MTDRDTSILFENEAPTDDLPQSILFEDSSGPSVDEKLGLPPPPPLPKKGFFDHPFETSLELAGGAVGSTAGFITGAGIGPTAGAITGGLAGAGIAQANEAGLVGTGAAGLAGAGAGALAGPVVGAVTGSQLGGSAGAGFGRAVGQRIDSALGINPQSAQMPGYSIPGIPGLDLDSNLLRDAYELAPTPFSSPLSVAVDTLFGIFGGPGKVVADRVAKFKDVNVPAAIEVATRWLPEAMAGKLGMGRASVVPREQALWEALTTEGKMSTVLGSGYLQPAKDGIIVNTILDPTTAKMVVGVKGGKKIDNIIDLAKETNDTLTNLGKSRAALVDDAEKAIVAHNNTVRPEARVKGLSWGDLDLRGIHSRIKDLRNTYFKKDTAEEMDRVLGEVEKAFDATGTGFSKYIRGTYMNLFDQELLTKELSLSQLDKWAKVMNEVQRANGLFDAGRAAGLISGDVSKLLSARDAADGVIDALRPALREAEESILNNAAASIDGFKKQFGDGTTFSEITKLYGAMSDASDAISRRAAQVGSILTSQPPQGAISKLEDLGTAGLATREFAERTDLSKRLQSSGITLSNYSKFVKENKGAVAEMSELLSLGGRTLRSYTTDYVPPKFFMALAKFGMPTELIENVFGPDTALSEGLPRGGAGLNKLSPEQTKVLQPLLGEMMTSINNAPESLKAKVMAETVAQNPMLADLFEPSPIQGYNVWDGKIVDPYEQETYRQELQSSVKDPHELTAKLMALNQDGRVLMKAPGAKGKKANVVSLKKIGDRQDYDY